jgi:diaminopimelate decarboxylase
MNARAGSARGVPEGFTVAGGCLQVGGASLTTLAERAGRTPFYAYDRELITRRVAHLRAHLPAPIDLHYAIKANPMAEVVDHLRGLVGGFDVASAGEMEIALRAGMEPADVSFAGPGKTDEELARAVAAGITVHLESEGEMERLAAIATATGVRPRVAVRVNPDFELKSSGMRMGGGPRQFGVDAERVPRMLSRLAEVDLEFIGFHIFWGSQNLSAEAIRDAQEKTVTLALRLAEHAPSPVRLLNIGGGLGIPYFPKDQPLDLAAVGEGLAMLVSRVADRLPEARMVVELGRYIVGEAGVYVCRVVDRKESRGQIFLVTDGGLHHHLAASGNFGQVIRRNYPVAIGTRMGESETETVSVVGRLCTPLDLLADRVELPRAEVGDLVVIFQSGAYGLTASPAAFLGHPPAAEMLV